MYNFVVQLDNIKGKPDVCLKRLTKAAQAYCIIQFLQTMPPQNFNMAPPSTSVCCHHGQVGLWE